MRKNIHIVLMVALIALTASQYANALSVKLCSNWKVSFDDANANVGDDIYTDNTDKMAYGAYLLVRDSSASTLFDNYTDSTGCTPYLTVDYNENLTIIMSTKSKIGTNYINVYDKSGSFYFIRGYTFNKAYTTSGIKSINNGTQDEATNMISSLSRALYSHNGGLSSKTYNAYNYASSGGGYSSGYNIYIDDISADRKYIPVHEYGHAMLYGKTGVWWPDCSLDDGGSKCDGAASGSGDHWMLSKEYQSCGLSEGWAHFVSAATWNLASESSCEFAYWSPGDFDDDGYTDSDVYIGCETGDYPEYSKWMEEKCTGDLSGYSNEWDWLMSFWDLRTDSSIAFNTLLEMLHDIYPGNWNDDETLLYSRAQTAANTNGFLSDFNTKTSYNGVDH